jgi:rubrerythrin
VGETLGVAEAMAAAESARVPAVRRVLERIAADELRHASWAWRSLAWLLREADVADRVWAQALLERAIRAVAEASGSSHGPHRPADGVLGPVARAQLHHEASSRVLAPLARALCLNTGVTMRAWQHSYGG